ncbi:hypothetical protein AJ80_05490 [Polytolypa hystricis UAMH7299]|uniref:Enoyl-CoA hydratase n=1 Tax=Polytolypa hystricis (strain UAMH7299) TaxID=1447883 RepID=A0A2B7Y343_POLH7|nr:hypothetical protein AJ80_05490 [Polytolypa hystricis UAMH7299]
MSGVALKYEHNLAVITLDNPKKLNALSAEQYHLLASHLREIAERPDIKFTVLIGTGRFFSAGIELKKEAQAEGSKQTMAPRLQAAQGLSHIIEVTEAFYTHPKVLITALNGPVVGLSAALVAHSDFIYAMPHVYLLAPFTALGVAAEGGATAIFIQRLGFAKAQEALLMSKRISSEELVRSGFVNEVFDTGNDADRFLARVLEEISSRFKGLRIGSVLQNKALIRRQFAQLIESQTVAETLAVVGTVTQAIQKQSKEKL